MHKKILTYEIGKNFIWRALQIFGKQGITFLIFILCAKLLTPYDFGIYNYALAIIFFLIMFGDFGISTATSKYVAEYNAIDKEKLKSILFNSGIIILGLTIIITILTLIIGPWYLQDKYVYVLWLLPLIFLASMTSLYDGIYRGLKRFKQLAIISLVIGFISLFFVYFLIKAYGLMGALISQNLFYLILLFGLAFGYKEFNFKWNKKIVNEIGSYSAIVGLAGLGYFLFTRLDVLLLGYYGYIVELGYYEIVNKIFLLILLPFTLFAQVISPDITSLYFRRKKEIVKRLYKRYFLISAIVSLFAVALIFLLFPEIMKVLFSQYYNSLALKIMNFLLIILVTQCIATVVSTGFAISTGHAKINTYFLLVFGFLNIPVTFIFIKLFGFMGAVYSTLLIRLTSDIIYFYVYTRLLWGKNEII